MSSGAVGKRYAKALFEVASDKQQLDLVEQDLLLIDQVLAQSPAFLSFLQHPQLENKLKIKEFNQAFEGKVSETVLTFMNLLIDTDRENAISEITQSYIRQANKARGLVDARVISIEPLTDEEKSNLSERYSQLLNKKIRIHNEVDSSIIGGIIVQIGDRLYDGSVRGKLHRFKRRVVS
jgi:F-type H+-transporting ATPase subunit delta